MSMVFHESSQNFHDIFPHISLSRQTASQIGSHLAPHWHERMEIWHVRSGQMVISCDRDIFEVSQGDILVVNPGQVHSCRVNQIPCAIDCMIFDLNGLLTHRPGEIDTLIRSVRTGTIRFRHIVHNHRLLQQIITQIMECTPAESWSSMRVNGLLFQLLSILSEKYVSTEDYAVPRHLQEVGSLLEYIHTQFARELTLEKLAEKACMTPTYFCRWFKAAVGESPMAYVTTVRINKAYELLMAGFRVTDACHRVGISDLNSFTRQFQKRVGVAPSKIKIDNSYQ